MPSLAALLVASACAPSNTLSVQLVSNMSPLDEVDTAHVEILRAGAVVLDSRVLLGTHASLGRPTRLVDVQAIASGRYDVSVTLEHAGASVQRRHVVRDVVGREIVTLLMTRDCNGVTCPAADAAAVECLGGRCVPPTCDEEHPDLCASPACHVAGDCTPSGVECAPAACSASGACFAAPDDALCGDGRICDERRGCVVVGADAGVGDAGPADAGARFMLLARAVGTDAGTTAVSTAIDTSGATLLVAVVVGYQGSSLGLTDSASNTWIPLTQAGPSTGGNGTGTTVMRLYYVSSPISSTSHTFTATADALFASIEVLAWNGPTTLDTEVAMGNANGAASFSAGTLTPGRSNELIIAGWGSNDDYGANLATLEIDGGFTILDAMLNPAGESIAVATLESPSLAPLSPRWTMGPNATTAVAVMAAFR